MVTWALGTAQSISQLLPHKSLHSWHHWCLPFFFPGEEIRTWGDQTTYLIQGLMGPRTRPSMSPWPTVSLCSQPVPEKLKGFWLPGDSNSFLQSLLEK